MTHRTTGSGSDSRTRPGRVPGASVDDRRIDRRTVLRTAGAVLAAGVLAGCSRDGDDDGVGIYAVDASDPRAPTEETDRR